MFFKVFTWFYWNQVASVCGRTMEWRSLPTTRATEPLHLMWLSPTPNDLLVMPPRIRWHEILRTLPLAWHPLADHFWHLQCKRRLGTLHNCASSWWAVIDCTCHDQTMGNVGQWYQEEVVLFKVSNNGLLFWQLLDCLFDCPIWIFHVSVLKAVCKPSQGLWCKALDWPQVCGPYRAGWHQAVAFQVRSWPGWQAHDHRQRSRGGETKTHKDWQNPMFDEM